MLMSRGLRPATLSPTRGPRMYRVEEALLNENLQWRSIGIGIQHHSRILGLISKALSQPRDIFPTSNACCMKLLSVFNDRVRRLVALVDPT